MLPVLMLCYHEAVILMSVMSVWQAVAPTYTIPIPQHGLSACLQQPEIADLQTRCPEGDWAWLDILGPRNPDRLADHDPGSKPSETSSLLNYKSSRPAWLLQGMCLSGKFHMLVACAPDQPASIGAHASDAGTSTDDAQPAHQVQLSPSLEAHQNGSIQHVRHSC